MLGSLEGTSETDSCVQRLLWGVLGDTQGRRRKTGLGRGKRWPTGVSTEASSVPTGRSGDGMVLQSCLKLRQRGGHTYTHVSSSMITDHFLGEDINLMRHIKYRCRSVSAGDWFHDPRRYQIPRMLKSPVWNGTHGLAHYSESMAQIFPAAGGGLHQPEEGVWGCSSVSTTSSKWFSKNFTPGSGSFFTFMEWKFHFNVLGAPHAIIFNVTVIVVALLNKPRFYYVPTDV